MAAPLRAVGIGPGPESAMTPQAASVISASACLAGYDLYLDLLPPRLKEGRRIIASGMRQEAERCGKAIDAALSGLSTALISSGDSGVYGMASLALELLERRGLLGDLPFEVIPGLPALCAAAALLGAPLGHDFACVSLSDLLTPWPLIEARLEAALAADFVCVLYNPRSRGRPHYLKAALDIAARHREAACPVGMARNVGRKGESTRLAPLRDFDPEWADMLSLVIIGSRESRMAGKYMLTPRGYAQKLSPSRNQGEK